MRSRGVCNFIGGAQARGSKTYPQRLWGVVFVVATSVLTFCTVLPMVEISIKGSICTSVDNFADR